MQRTPAQIIMRQTKYSGVYTALVTPMNKGEVDYDDLKKLVDKQIAGGVAGLIPVGTTGESPTLNTEEHLEVIKAVVEFADKRVPVIAGTGSNSTREARHLVKTADAAGVDGHLQVCPYYNKPTQEGIYTHFAEVAEVTDKDIMLYSIPGRCVVEIGVETTARLHQNYPQINCIKEAGGRSDRISQLRRALPEETFSILSGDDSLTLPFMSVGATGVVSVASNIVPEKVAGMVNAALKGDFIDARKKHFELYSLFTNLFIEPNPVPAKFALKKIGMFKTDDVRKPLMKITDNGANILSETLAKLGL